MTYQFYLEQNILCCKVMQQGHIVMLKDLSAKRALQKLDTSFIQRVKMKGSHFIVETDDGLVYFEDIDSIINNGNAFFLRNMLKRIQKEMCLKQKRKHQKKSIRNLKVVGAATISGFALLALVSTASGHEHEPDVLEPVAIEKEAEPSLLDMQTILNALIDDVQNAEDTINSEELLEDNVTYLNYASNRYSITGEGAYQAYYETVETYANKWGIAPKLVMAMLTQESAGKKVNLMQIEFDVWKDSPITVYNFNDNCYNHFVLTDSPEKYAGENVVCITRSDLDNPITNISISCVLLRESLKYMNYHVGAGIQCYNFGYGNMQTTLALTAQMEGIPVEQILNNQENLSFMNYTEEAVKDKTDKGDFMYLNHVMQYIENPEEGIWVRSINELGQIEEIRVTIFPSTKKYNSI